MSESKRERERKCYEGTVVPLDSKERRTRERERVES